MYVIYDIFQVSSGYELYMVLEPMCSKIAIMNAANSVVKFMKREEDRLFIITSATW